MNSPELSTERWRQVRALLEVAFDLPQEQRIAHVRKAAGSDPALAEEVLRLLFRDQSGAEALEPPHARRPFAEVPASTSASSKTGRRVGPWKLQRELGTGGMGTVYLAVRADGEFERQVALKLIKPGMDSEEVLQRFRRERQVLANLDHPGIARLVDGGRTEEGLPYLVMEYVEGQPVDRWCDRERLSPRERVELFAEICDAVQFAHEQLVVHRDLKPGNVIVAEDGRPKLLDFGIAKVLDSDGIGDAEPLTGSMLRMMTPEYASPEQVRGEHIGPASDVYSLGVVLYQLLTGHMPHRFRQRSPAEIWRAVCEEPPERPSTVVTRPLGESTLFAQDLSAGATGSLTPGELSGRRGTTPTALRRSLSGDLDRIVLMALRKEPRRRYASVRDLADDLRRWLAGHPVTARPDTLGYRTSRFIRRNAAAVALALAVLLALTTGLVYSRFQYLAAETARGKESVQRGLAEGRAEELEILADELRDREAEATLQRNAATAARARAEERSADVRRLATTLLFDVYNRVYALAGSERAREILVQTGLEFLEELADEAADDPELQRQLAGAYTRLGSLPGIAAETALDHLRRSVEHGELAVALDAEDPRNAYSLGSAYFALGTGLTTLGRLDEAEEALALGLEASASIVAAERPLVGHLQVVADLSTRLAELAVRFGRTEEGERYLDRAARVRFDQDERFPHLPYGRAGLADIHALRGRIARARGDLAGCLEETALAVSLVEPVRAENPTSTTFRQQAYDIVLNHVRALGDSGRFTEALEHLVALRADMEQAVRGPGGAVLHETLALVLATTAHVHFDLGQFEEGLEATDSGLALVENLPGATLLAHRLHRGRGALLRRLGRLEASREELVSLARRVERIPLGAAGDLHWTLAAQRCLTEAEIAYTSEDPGEVSVARTQAIQHGERALSLLSEGQDGGAIGELVRAALERCRAVIDGG